MPASGFTQVKDAQNPAAIAYSRQMLAAHGIQVPPGADATALWRQYSQNLMLQRNAARYTTEASPDMGVHPGQHAGGETFDPGTFTPDPSAGQGSFDPGIPSYPHAVLPDGPRIPPASLAAGALSERPVSLTPLAGLGVRPQMGAGQAVNLLRQAVQRTRSGNYSNRSALAGKLAQNIVRNRKRPGGGSRRILAS